MVDDRRDRARYGLLHGRDAVPFWRRRTGVGVHGRLRLPAVIPRPPVGQSDLVTLTQHPLPATTLPALASTILPRTSASRNNMPCNASRSRRGRAVLRPGIAGF